MKLSLARTLAIASVAALLAVVPSRPNPCSPLPPARSRASRSPVKASQIKASPVLTNQVPASRSSPATRTAIRQGPLPAFARPQWRHRQHHRPRRQARRSTCRGFNCRRRRSPVRPYHRPRSRCPSQYADPATRRPRPRNRSQYRHIAAVPRSAPNLVVTQLGAHPYRWPRSIRSRCHHQFRLRPHRPASRGCHPPRAAACPRRIRSTRRHLLRHYFRHRASSHIRWNA